MCVILNGMIKSDTEGAYTFISHNGASVIDLAIISYDLYNRVSSFQILDWEYSNHFPIELTLSLNENEPKKELALIPRLRWTRRDG